MPRVWTEEQKKRMRETMLWRRQREMEQRSTVPAFTARPIPSAVTFNCSVKVDMEDLARLAPAQLNAFMHGIAQVIAAQQRT